MNIKTACPHCERENIRNIPVLITLAVSSKNTTLLRCKCGGQYLATIKISLRIKTRKI